MNDESLMHHLQTQLRQVLSTTLDAPVDASAGSAGDMAWSIRVTRPGAPQLAFAFDPTGAEAMARTLTGVRDLTEETIAQALKEFCANVIAAVPGLDAAGAVVETPQLTAWPESRVDDVVRFESAALAIPLVVGVLTAPPAATNAAAQAAPVQAMPNESARLDVLLDIDLPLVVRFGGTQLPLKTLSRLGPGSLIDLSRAPDDPVEMLVGDRVVARGEVVVVSGCYGIRVLEVVGGRDGGRVLEGR